jgi:hypothetical protein
LLDVGGEMELGNEKDDELFLVLLELNFPVE